MTRHTPTWLQAGSYAASDDRTLIGALWPRPACVGCLVSVASGMNLNIAAGQVAVPSQNNTGSTLCVSDAQEQVSVASAPGSGNNRIDLVVCQPRGTDLDGGGNNDFIFTTVQGAATPTPTPPATPAGTVALAQVYVTGGTAAIVAANLTDVRPIGGLSVQGDPMTPVSGSAALQFVTDNTGEVWMAKGGVNGGLWVKAKDFLRCRVSRNAGITTGVAGFNAMPWDSKSYDPYGVAVTSPPSVGFFTAPISGYYRINSTISTQPVANGRLICSIFVNGTEVGRGTDHTSSGTIATGSVAVDTVPLNAGDVVSVQMYVTQATPVATGATLTYSTVAFQAPLTPPGVVAPRIVTPSSLPPALGPTDPFQSVTDQSGEVWIAKGGVAGGQWKRARDFLVASYHRNAAVSLGAGASAIGMDTRDYDDYGLYSPGTAVITLPLAGIWRIGMGLLTSSSVSMQMGLSTGSGAPSGIWTFVKACATMATFTPTGDFSIKRRWPAGQQLVTTINFSAAGSLNVNQATFNFVDIAYEGPSS